MNVHSVALDERAFVELDRANRGNDHDWLQVFEWLQEGAAQVWDVNGEAYVLTLANGDDEIEVLMCGGKNARSNAPLWEAAMVAHPAHRGKVLRLEGRKGWRRILKGWDCDENGVLTKRVPS